MKKTICLIMMFIICLTATCYAGTTLSDIKDTKFQAAVEKLVTFEIINGYEDGTYRPNEKVTRAQLSKIIITAMGKSDELEAAKKKFLSFPDVLSTHWGYGYIKIASDSKIINGYDDGKFKPDGNVTYAEATAMMIRALDFEDAVKQTGLTWPNNYMSYADEKLELFESMGEFKATDPITRGNMAILMWNTLRKGMADIVATNDKGLVYGEGTAMITTYLNYIYQNEAEFVDVEFSDDLKTAIVTLKEKNKKAKEFEFDAEDVLEMYGRKVTLLYDSKNKRMVELDAKTDYKVIDAEVTNVSKTKIYISSRSTGYTLPDEDNILYYGIDDLKEAVNVILLVDGTNIKYMVASGTSEASVAIIVDDDALVGNAEDKNYGVKIREIGETKGGSSYMLADEDNWPDEGDIYLYYINADDLFVSLKKVDTSKKVEIEGIYKSYLETKSGSEYEYDDEDDYTVVIVGSSKLGEGELSDINIKTDKIIPIEYNGHVFFLVYEDAIEDDIDDDIADALSDLEDVIDDAYDLDEADYTQESYALLMEEVTYGESLDYTYSLSKIKRATTNIEDAIDELEDVAKKEIDTVELKKEFREYIKDTVEDYIEDEDKYTVKSFANLEELYDEAIELLEATDADYDEIDDLYDDLQDAISELVKK